MFKGNKSRPFQLRLKKFSIWFFNKKNLWSVNQTENILSIAIFIPKQSIMKNKKRQQKNTEPVQISSIFLLAMQNQHNYRRKKLIFSLLLSQYHDDNILPYSIIPFPYLTHIITSASSGSSSHSNLFTKNPSKS